MKIKSILMAFAMVAAQLVAFAQKGELNSAKAAYDKYNQLKQAGSLTLAMPSLNSAKTSIEKASVNEKTKADPAVWAYKALVYANIALNDSVSVSSEASLAESKSAFKTFAELDQSGANKALADEANGLYAQYELNKGVKAYQTQKYADAYASFNNSLNYKPGDTTLTYYAGLSAINAQNYPAAISKYAELLKTNFSANKSIALDLSRIYAIQKDTTQAIAVAAQNAAKFNDAALATQEIELSLMSGRGNQIISKISQQAANDPKNKVNQFYLGIAYAAGKDYKKSEEAYKKALEIDPKYGDALLNLSSTILNKGIDLYNAANKLPASKQKEYEIAIKQANAEFERALPYLQQAVETSPKSVNAWENLKTYYIVKRNQAKVDEINKTIKGL
ncbi:MAG: tetratricopeptide repeat protein [Sphingobacteriaceae bacterium]